jgi:glycosyltransferase involved in cell wall biosynthesis
MQPHGGVSRYFVELIQALELLGSFEAHVPEFFTDNQYLERKRALLTHRPFKGKVRLMSALNRRISLRSLRCRFDLFHPTYFKPYFLPRLTTPFVVTVHDMTHDLFGHEHVRDDGTRLNRRVLCEKAARIIAVSQATKNDLCRLLNVPDSKVAVIHHSTSLRYHGEECLHPGKYLLYVGERSGYKNFDFLLSSLAALVRRERLDFVCVGSHPFSAIEKALISCLGLGQYVLHRNVSTSAELVSLYHFASAFCYPSLHEGFGMPLLEAFSCGCPVVASSISSFSEVAGEAVEYFDPKDASSIASSVERVILDARRAAALMELGRQRLKFFSWEKAARATLEVYRSAI